MGNGLLVVVCAMLVGLLSGVHLGPIVDPVVLLSESQTEITHDVDDLDIVVKDGEWEEEGSPGQDYDWDNPASILVLVNKQHDLPADYVPKDLVKANVRFSFSGSSSRQLMRQEAAMALEELFSAAKAEGIDLAAVSGYRSYETQRAIFAARARERGHEVANRTSALPGQSEHQTGLAMDVSSASVNYGLTAAFGETPEGLWLAENCSQFGFIIRYPQGKEHITGYNYEPWHLRYVGVEVAQYIAAEGFTLEEFFGQAFEATQTR